MLEDQLLRLRILKVDGEAIIVVLAIRVVSITELPVQIRHLLLQAGLLPDAQYLGPGAVAGLAGVLLPLVVGQPAVLLVDDGLLGLAA